MKELSIEQKARAYDEAIKRANELSYVSDKDSLQRKTVEHIFPELKESEDEKIRMWLIRLISTAEYRILDSDPMPCSRIELINYLEKQAEKKPLNKIKIGKEYKCIASPRYSTFIKGNIYKPKDEFLCSLMNFCSDCFEPIEDGKQNHNDKIEPKFKKGDIIKEKETGNLFYVNSVEDSGYTLHYKNYIAKGCTMEFKYEDNYELAPSWGEDDEKIISDIYDCIKNLPIFYKTVKIDGEDKTANQFVYNVRNWLDFLKERLT